MAERGPWRRRLAWVAVAVACLLGGVHGLWWWSVRQIEKGVPGFVEAAARQGWAVTAASVGRGGWPVAARVVARGVVAAREGADGLRVSFETLEVEHSPGALGVLVVRVPGGVGGRVSVGLGERGLWTVDAEGARLLVPLDGGAMTFAGQGLDVRAVEGGRFIVGTLAGELGAGGFSAVAAGVQGSPGLAAPFDRGAEIRLRGEVTEAGAGAGAAGWRAAGGVVRVPELAVAWGPFRAVVHGEGGLDAGLQPEAAGEARVVGAVELLQAGVAAGQVAAGGAQAVRSVLGLLSGGVAGREVVVPIGLRRGALVVAGFPVLRVGQ